MEKKDETGGNTQTKRRTGKAVRRGRPPKIKVGGRKLDFILAAQLRERTGWNTTDVVRHVAEQTRRDVATVWRHMNAAREINRKEDEQEERRKGEAFNRIACELVEGVQAQEREAAAEEEDTRRLAEEAKIDGLWIFRRTAIRETVTVICAVLKDIEKSIGRKLSARDVISMRQLADGYNRLEIATADIERDGYYIETARGALVLHPAHKLKADAMADCMSIMKQYGLTMYARDRIKAFGGEDGGDIGGFDLGDTNFDD